jgi:hypothetical protein
LDVPDLVGDWTLLALLAMCDEVTNFSDGSEAVAAVAQPKEYPIKVYYSTIATDVAFDAMAEFSRLHTGALLAGPDQNEIETLTPFIMSSHLG